MTWGLLNNDAAALRVFERKVLCKIFGSVRVSDNFRIRYNSVLYELLNDLDVVQRINIQQLRWLGHAVRMEEDALARRIFDVGICGSRRRGQPCIHWKNKIEDWCGQLAKACKNQQRLSRACLLRQADIR